MTMKDVEKNDILVFDSGKRVKVKSVDFLDPDSFQSYRIITQEGEEIWVSEDGLTDTDPKTDFIRAIGCDEPTLDDLLRTDDLPAEMKWVNRNKRLNHESENLMELIKPFKRDFSVSELAVLYYRANKKPINKSAMNQNCLHWKKMGLMEATGRGRYRLK